MSDSKSEPKKMIRHYFNPRVIWNGGLGYLAYIIFAPPFLPALIHKLRGVKMKNYKTIGIGANVLIDGNFPERISIGDYVFIARGTKIICHSTFNALQQELTGVEYVVGDIVIEDGAYIGVNCVILPNVHIGRCAVVAAGAVVTTNVPDYAMVGGVPAKKIGDFRDYAKKLRKDIKDGKIEMYKGRFK